LNNTSCYALPCRRFTSTIAWRIILSGSGLPINAIFQDRRIGPSSMISAACQVQTFCARRLLFLIVVGQARLLRHHMRDDDSCGLCSQVDESIDHLRLGCCFTREVWSCLLVGSGLQQLCSSPDDRIVDWWVSCRKKLPKCSRGGFDSMVVLVWWLVWGSETTVFNGAMQQAATLVSWIREEASLWVYVGVSPALIREEANLCFSFLF
jgi:hypothetical protein